MTRSSRRPRVLLLACALAGCATTPPGIAPDPALLTFLEDGVTPRSEALLRLGEPSWFFEADRILTWRIAGDEKRGSWVQSRALLANQRIGALVPRASLVLVFDQAGILERHALVAIEQ